MKNILGIGLALLVLGSSALPVAIAQAQSAAPTVSADKPAMERDRAISRRLSEADRARAQKLFASSFSFWQAGSYDAARAGFERGLAIDPANGRANYYLGDTLLHQNDPAGARSRFLRTLAYDPDSAEAIKAQAALARLAPLLAAQRSLPRSTLPSTYPDDCRDIGVAGSTLTAICRRDDGSYLKSDIAIPGIANVDGDLQFSGMDRASTFQNSCRDIRVTGDMLTANCRGLGAAFVPAAIRIYGIADVDGSLKFR